MKKLKELADKIAAEHGLEWYQPLNKAEDSAGMTAIDLGSGYSLHHEHSENGHDIWSVGYKGERAGTFMLRTEDTRRGKPMVAWAGLEKTHRGKGVGTLAYKALAAHYGGLDSDKASSSDDAIKAWVRAGGRQMKIKTQFGKPRYTLDGDKKNPPIVWNEDLGKAEQELLEKSKIYDLYSPESEYEIKQEKSRFDASLGRNGTELNVFGLYHKPTGKRIGQHIYYSKLNRAKSLKLGEAVYSHYTQSIDIEPEHRRKGLANAMYMHAERSGPYDRMAFTRNRTEEGKALWSQPNRPFGKSAPFHSLHLINKFEGSDFAPTEFHYSVKSNGKEIGRAIVFDKDPRSIHQAGKTGPSLKDIRLHPDYQGQGHSQGIINKLVDMHGPLASDSRGNISPAGTKMFHKYGIKQPDESYILHGQSLKKSIENLIKGFKSQWGDPLPDTDNSHVERNEWWHGTPSGKFPLNNIHMGSKRAAHEALTARIGHPAEGEWDGTREYGKTLLAGRKTLEAKGIPITGYSVDAPLEDYYPTGKATYSDGTQIALSEKPTMLRFKIKGKMTSHPHAPRTDMAANAIMNRKGIKRGIYYVNEAEDPGSISAVVPSAEHLEQINNSSIKKSSNIDSLIQQAKARLEGVKKVGSQEPRPMIFASKDGKKHAFVTVDPSKKGQWRVTHFINSKPAGHSEAPTFSHAIKVAHESGYNVFKEIPEEELFKAESLIKAAHPSDLKRITSKTNPKAQEIVDAAPHAVHAPDQAYVDFLNHPTVQKGLGKRDVGGISAKMVHKVGDDTYMAKPYHKRIESATKAMNPHPISGWSTMATRNLFHAAGIGNLCEDVSFHEHNGVPMTVHKFAKDVSDSSDLRYMKSADKSLVGPAIEADAKKIAIMDFLTNNVDRHGGNVMVRSNGSGAHGLLAIDHERGFQYNQPAGLRYSGNPSETPRAYLRHTGLKDAVSTPSWMDDEEASYMPEGHTTKDWWKANRDNIINSFNKDVESIKDPHLKKHIHTNFMKRVDWLDEFSHPDHYSFFSEHNYRTPVEMFKERRSKTDYKAIMKNLPENPYKAIGVIDSLFSKKLSPATKETLVDLWNEQVDKMSGEEVGNYFKDIRKTKNHPHPKGAHFSLMKRLAEKNHRQGMQHLVQNNMIDLPYWKDKFEEALKKP